MTLPEKPASVGEMLIDVILQSQSHIDQVELINNNNQLILISEQASLPDWINAVGLLLSNLPDSYWTGLHNKLESAVSGLRSWSHVFSPTQMFDFTEVHNLNTDTGLSGLLAVGHAAWHHSGFNQVSPVTCPSDTVIPLQCTGKISIFKNFNSKIYYGIMKIYPKKKYEVRTNFITFLKRFRRSLN